MIYESEIAKSKELLQELKYSSSRLRNNLTAIKKETNIFESYKEGFKIMLNNMAITETSIKNPEAIKLIEQKSAYKIIL